MNRPYPTHVARVRKASMADLPLHNQVALVTGASRRLGRVIALTLGRAGADVVVNYSQSQAGAEATAREIRSFGARSLALHADVARPAQVTAMFRRVEREFGRLDLLVNNAGIFFPVRWDKLGEKDWDRILGVNLKGAFYCAQAAARMMLKRKRGCIINISSLGGIQAWPGYIHYCASKAANIMLTRCLAKALAPHIQVNSIAPGTILLPDEKITAETRKIIARTPLKKAGTAQDVAEMVLYLATRGDFITGQVFVVDGGKSIP